MPENAGYYEKYNVSRKDGRDQPGGDREGAQYFVLDLSHDRFARLAMNVYLAVSRSELPALTQSMRPLLDRLAENEPL